MSNAQEFNFTQELVLPSKGLLNPEIPEGKLIQRCMMVSDQKFLLGGNQSSGAALNQLVQRTITTENFNIMNLTFADTLYLLFKLRVLSYGDEYTFRSKCPECGKKIEVTVNMADLPVTSLEDNYTDKLVVKLPRRGDTVYTRLLTNQDIEDINSEIKRRQKRDNNSDSSDYVLRIARSIEKIELAKPIDGVKELTHSFEIERYVEALTDLDAATITAARESITFGISPIVEQVCPECRQYIDISINFSGDFFRPNISK